MKRKKKLKKKKPVSKQNTCAKKKIQELFHHFINSFSFLIYLHKKFLRPNL